MEILPPGSHFSSVDDYQDSEQMVQDVLKVHNMQDKSIDLKLIEQIQFMLQGKIDMSASKQ